MPVRCLTKEVFPWSTWPAVATMRDLDCISFYVVLLLGVNDLLDILQNTLGCSETRGPKLYYICI